MDGVFLGNLTALAGVCVCSCMLAWFAVAGVLACFEELMGSSHTISSNAVSSEGLLESHCVVKASAISSSVASRRTGSSSVCVAGMSGAEEHGAELSVAAGILMRFKRPVSEVDCGGIWLVAEDVASGSGPAEWERFIGGEEGVVLEGVTGGTC